MLTEKSWRLFLKKSTPKEAKTQNAENYYTATSMLIQDEKNNVKVRKKKETLSSLRNQGWKKFKFETEKVKKIYIKRYFKKPPNWTT